MYDQGNDLRVDFVSELNQGAEEIVQQNKDCRCGECLPIYNKDSQVAETAVKVQEKLKEMNPIFKDKEVKYGLINDAARDTMFTPTMKVRTHRPSLSQSY